MNGLAITIIVGQLPKLFGFSTDADGFVDEVEQFVDESRRDRRARRCSSGVGVLVVLLVLPRFSCRIPGVLVAVVGATVAVRRRSDLADEGVATVGALPAGLPKPTIPWTTSSDVGPLLSPRSGITLVSLTDTIATSTSFAARRGDEVEPEPGDDRDRRRERRRRIVPGVRGLHQRLANRGRGAVWRQEPGHRPRGRRRRVVVLLLFLNSLLADLPQTALAAVVIAAALSLMDIDVLRRYWPVRRRPSCSPSLPRPG